MHPTGFSTGALTKGDFSAALEWIEPTDSDAIELSALREGELRSLIATFDSFDLTRFRYTAIHAPKSFEVIPEQDVVRLLMPLARRGFPVVVHPDAITNYGAWRTLGASVCVENMDMRKRTGRTVREIAAVFTELPEARLCFDLAHARQVDPSMAVAMNFVRTFGDRVSHVHVSEVDSRGYHWGMSRSCLHAFAVAASRLPEGTPVIVESQVARDRMTRELAAARALFSGVCLTTP
jgi:hypothetical protein